MTSDLTLNLEHTVRMRRRAGISVLGVLLACSTLFSSPASAAQANSPGPITVHFALEAGTSGTYVPGGKFEILNTLGKVLTTFTTTAHYQLLTVPGGFKHDTSFRIVNVGQAPALPTPTSWSESCDTDYTPNWCTPTIPPAFTPEGPITPYPLAKTVTFKTSWFSVYPALTAHVQPKAGVAACGDCGGYDAVNADRALANLVPIPSRASSPDDPIVGCEDYLTGVFQQPCTTGSQDNQTLCVTTTPTGPQAPDCSAAMCWIGGPEAFTWTAQDAAEYCVQGWFSEGEFPPPGYTQSLMQIGLNGTSETNAEIQWCAQGEPTSWQDQLPTTFTAATCTELNYAGHYCGLTEPYQGPYGGQIMTISFFPGNATTQPEWIVASN